MDKSTPEKFARTMLEEMAQIRAVVESLHDIITNSLRQRSGANKTKTNRLVITHIAKQQRIIYARLLKRAGLDEPVGHKK